MSRPPTRTADAIIGVSFFADTDPDDFSRFDRGFMSLFKILAGDSWIPGLDELNEDGSMNVPAAAYICSFRLVVEWILLQVRPGPARSGPTQARQTGHAARYGTGVLRRFCSARQLAGGFALVISN